MPRPKCVKGCKAVAVPVNEVEAIKKPEFEIIQAFLLLLLPHVLLFEPKRKQCVNAVNYRDG